MSKKLNKKAKAPPKVKKRPQQTRSKQLIESIFLASSELFEKIPIQNISTNRIAEFTGVSIGSLYQYFTNKNSLFSEFIDRRLEDNREKIRSILAESKVIEFEPFVDQTVDSIVDYFLTQKGYLRSLIFLQFELQKNDKMIRSRWLMSEILANEFHNRYPTLGSVTQLQKKFFYLINSGFGIVYMYSQVSDLPLCVEDIKLEMKNNVKAYLKYE